MEKKGLKEEEIAKIRPNFGNKQVRNISEIVWGEKYVLLSGTEETPVIALKGSIDSTHYKNRIWVNDLFSGKCNRIFLHDYGVIPHENGMWSRTGHIEKIDDDDVEKTIEKIKQRRGRMVVNEKDLTYDDQKRIFFGIQKEARHDDAIAQGITRILPEKWVAIYISSSVGFFITISDGRVIRDVAGISNIVSRVDKKIHEMIEKGDDTPASKLIISTYGIITRINYRFPMAEKFKEVGRLALDDTLTRRKAKDLRVGITIRRLVSAPRK